MENNIGGILCSIFVAYIFVAPIHFWLERKSKVYAMFAEIPEALFRNGYWISGCLWLLFITLTIGFMLIIPLSKIFP